MTAKYDYSQILKERDLSKESWKTLTSSYLPIGRKIEDLLKLTVRYQGDTAEATYRMLATYLLMPSAISANVPISFLYGVSGSGKSQVGKLASLLWDCKIYSPADTFAAIRNDIDKNKTHLVEYFDDDSEVSRYAECEKNMFMVWDDIDPSILKSKPDIFRMLKVGCDRTTSVISISSLEHGKNIQFDTFSPKMFSSVTPIHTIPEFGELARRIMVFYHKRSSELPIFLDDYNWEGFSDYLITFWDLTSAKAFVDLRNRIAKIPNRNELIDPSRWSILHDFVTAGIITGVWKDPVSAFKDIRVFFEAQEKLADKHKDCLETLLSDFISEHESNQITVIYNSSIRCRIDQWDKTGLLLEKPARGEVSRIMRSRGYLLDRGVWNKEQ